MDLIVMELEEIKSKYADARRTQIVATEAEINEEDLIQEEDMVVTISHGGYVKRTPVSTYRAQRRGGKGKIGMEARDEDFINKFFIASSHDHVLFFTNRGRVFLKKVHEVPEGSRTSRPRHASEMRFFSSGGHHVSHMVFGQLPNMEPPSSL